MSNDDLPFSTSDKNQPVKIRMGPGPASVAPKTIATVFDATVSKLGDKPALHQKVPVPGKEAADTPWTTWTWKEYRENCDLFAKSLIALGFEKKDIVNIIGFNAPQWHFSNFGCILAGGISAGIYATNEPEACKYISEHSNAKVVVVEGVKQLEKYYKIAADLPDLKALVMYGPDSVPDDIKDKVDKPVYTFDDFLKIGSDVTDEELKERTHSAEANEVATLIYTSGTTGPPKAVMITHDNVIWTTEIYLTQLERPLSNDDHIISFLPLSHIAAQVIDMYSPVCTGYQIWFAQPDALRGSLGATLKEVRPTIFFGVPRVWEKIYDKLQEIGRSSKGLKKKLSTWAKGKASAYWESHQFGGSQKSPSLFGLATKLLHKARLGLGFDRCFAFFVSAAPIDVKILKYFASINIPILELFGQSECTGPHASNTWNAWKIGTVGRPLPGTITRLDPNNGELQYSGRHIFAGYMKMKVKTAETISRDGFLCSGDVVKIDDCDQDDVVKPSGFITITGRIKELIITAGGENIPPVLIETEMRNAMPALANCMVIGDKRKFLSIVLCLQVEVDGEGVPSNKLTGTALETSVTIGSTAKTADEAKTCDKWKKYFDQGLEEANSKATSRAQKVAKWTLLSSDFSEKTGELTPTLKLKRSVTEGIHSEAIEAMYA